MISNLIVSHVKLTCDDEDATIEEQYEKILYYYPLSTSIKEQLSEVCRLDSLIQFSARFSSEPLQYVLMKNKTWGFVQCEPNVWIYASTTSVSTNIRRHVDEASLVNAIKAFYYLYRLYHGSINSYLYRGVPSELPLSSSSPPSPFNYAFYEKILRAKELRRTIRKYSQQLNQVNYDLEYLHHLNIKEDFKEVHIRNAILNSDAVDKLSESSQESTIESLAFYDSKTTHSFQQQILNIETKVLQARNELLNIINHEYYPPDYLRKQLNVFATWYIASGEMKNISFFHRYDGINRSGSLHPLAMSCVLKIQYQMSIRKDYIQGSLSCFFDPKNLCRL